MSEPQQIALQGVSHLALVCSDMARTVDFYTNVLGLPLIKTIELPAGMGQHFFLDIGNGDSLAFFWFPDAPPAAPGIEACRELLVARGVACSEVVNHDDSEWTVSEEMHPGVFVRSVYFQDPDGILLELAAWTRVLDETDVRHEPATASRVPATPRAQVGA